MSEALTEAALVKQWVAEIEKGMKHIQHLHFRGSIFHTLGNDERFIAADSIKDPCRGLGQEYQYKMKIAHQAVLSIMQNIERAHGTPFLLKVLEQIKKAD